MKNRLFPALCMLASCLLSCSKVEPDPRHEDKVDILLTKSETEYVRSGNMLGARMLDRLQERHGGSFLISPLSTQIALGLMAAGADGETQEEVVSFLGFGDDAQSTIQYLSSLSGQLKLADRKSDLQLSNLIMLNKDFGSEFRPGYKEYISSFPEAELMSFNFRKEHDEAARKANEWSSRQTAGMIPELMTAEELQKNPVAYVVNALYFKSSWTKPFKKENTRTEEFTCLDRTSRRTPMMNQRDVFRYYEKDGIKALHMDYGNGAFCYTAILPDDMADLPAVCGQLADGLLEEIQDNSNPVTVEVSIPKYKTEMTVDMKELCKAMGLTRPFDVDKANFGNMMSSDRRVAVTAFTQLLSINVDESGSEAAAVSKGELGQPTAGEEEKEEYKVFKADHPFVYAIYETSSGALLFMGIFGD